MANPKERATVVARQRFPTFTEEIEQALDEALKENKGCEDTSDTVVNAVWQKIGSFEDIQYSDDSTDVHAQAREALRQLIESFCSCRQDLYEGDPAVRDKLYREVSEQQRAEHEVRQTAMEELMPFSDPNVEANFAEWGGRPFWTAAEAAALSYGKDPEQVTWESVKRYKTRSPFVRRFEKRIGLIERAIKVGDLKEAIRPSDFLKWAKRKNVELPPGLLNVPESPRSRQTSEVAGDESEDGINHRTLHTFYAVLIGLAISKHGLDPKYDPETGGSAAFTSISNAIKDAGLNVSVKTLRKHAKAALKWAEGKELKLRAPKPTSTSSR
jgi:hypothetical protein